AAVRKTAPAALIDVHHPRLEKDIGYFYLGGFDDTRDEASRPGFSYDFDAIEVLNGYQDTNRRTIDRVLKDWFALLDRGHIVTATGNSDTHHLDYNIGGYPRNYVSVTNDDLATLDPSAVAASVKAHHSFFTTGPIVDVNIGGIGMGELAPAPGGKATLEIRVRAAPWVSVSRVIIYVAGKVTKTFELPKLPTSGPLAAIVPIERFHQKWPFTVPNDTYVVVRIEGDQSLSPVVGGGKDVTVFPFAITNPVFVDVDGNGKYDPVLPHGAHAKKAP
ncbi:MAG TPA: CehA/McbA family metallohydrolase, partial [Kofleriaceae bacterium]